jgi:manganese/zinc/iron transport system substrate-binding protein
MVRLWTFICIAAMLAGCAPGPDDSSSGDGPPFRVVATTTLVADLVRAIGGERVEVTPLMGAGVDPHLYKATAGDVQRMRTADLVVYTGLHLEGKMVDVLEQLPQSGVPATAVTECVPETQLLNVEGYDDVHDPHIWFDVSLWAAAASCVQEALVEIDPDGAATYSATMGDYGGQLEALNQWIRDQIATVPVERRILVTAHDAFAYFGAAYDIEVLGLLGVSTASEAGTSDVQELAELIVTRDIPAVFIETSVPTRYIEALQQSVRSAGGAVSVGGHLYSDALGDPDSPQGTYIGTVRHNVETIVSALGGHGTTDAP